MKTSSEYEFPLACDYREERRADDRFGSTKKASIYIYLGPIVLPATAISGRQHWIPFDLQS
jgi:hypothetical protein